jgi:hypothetical protein
MNMFSTTGPQCNLTFFHAASSNGTANLNTASWDSYVTYDDTAGLKIKHVGSYPTNSSNNYTISIFLRVISDGKVEAYREVKVDFLFSIYKAPVFEPAL